MKQLLRLRAPFVLFALIISAPVVFAFHNALVGPAPSQSLLRYKITLQAKQTARTQQLDQDAYDVVEVGSGLGGLSCAAMTALYGDSVAVLESHTHPGGAAHGFSVATTLPGSSEKAEFSFDTGPSFFSGLNPDLPPKSSNPLRTILDAIGEQVECVPYSTFGLTFPEGNFVHTADFGRKGGVLEQVTKNDDSQQAQQEWDNLMKQMEPLAAAVAALPTAALRADIGAALTCAPFLPDLMNPLNIKPWENLLLTQPYSSVLAKAGVENTFLLQWMDLLCFCLSGLPSNGTITAEMAMMMGEFYEPNAVMDCPQQGAQAIVQALVRGIEKYGGTVACQTHVNEIVVKNGRAIGVNIRSKGGEKQRFIKARKAVVSNLSIWDLLESGIVDTSAFPADFVAQRQATPVGKSFMHMHIGFRASRQELEQLQAHYMYMDDWNRGVQAQDNAVLISIPSVHDPSLAPDGYAVLHIYTPATEDYEKWRGLDRRSSAYAQLKQERSAYLWKVLEKHIPDIRDRACVTQVGTPLTHQRFLRRHMGSYGPAIPAGKGSFPFPGTPLQGLLLCGDSCFPGIGVPAVAGSGLLAANSISLDSLKPQMKVLDQLRKTMAA